MSSNPRCLMKFSNTAQKSGIFVFSAAEDMEKYLDIQPGSVSVLGLVLFPQTLVQKFHSLWDFFCLNAGIIDQQYMRLDR